MIRSIYRTITLLLTLSLCLNIWGAEETYSIRKSAIDIEEDMVFEIIDGKMGFLGFPGTYVKSTRMILKFGIDERTTYGYFVGSASISADVKVEKLSPFGMVESTTTQTLSISYSNGSGLETDLSVLKVEGGHRYRITVEELSLGGLASIPEFVYMEAELRVERYYELSEEAPSLGCNFLAYDTDNVLLTEFNVNGQATADHLLAGTDAMNHAPQEVQIYWSYVKGAEEYELEWTWVDTYDQTLSELKFSERAFELNNTRIITSGQQFSIPLIYAKGILIYRVRSIGRWVDNDLADTDKLYYGPWTTDGIPLIEAEDWPHYVLISSDHEALKNWQYQAVYAEDGKKKEIISYFDGSLRNRQTVTRINSNNEAIVGENVYDNQGRSAIQILPTPVGNSALKYHPYLNLNTEEQVYTHYDFDWNTDGVCVAPVMGMSTESGASKYYSANNAFSNNWQNYVPDAQEIPFVQVEYTPDNTGRIRRQSGVGETYKIDGAHATSYFYLQPFQEELNRLFGDQVGFRRHYKKNLVVDANGQVSISYIDPQGRVIATALAGDNSAEEEGETKTHLRSLDSHDDLTKHVSVTVDLLNKLTATDPDTEADDNLKFATGAQGINYDALYVNTQYPSTDTKLHNFNYTINTETFRDDCMPAGITYPFAYKLDIDLKDDCGVSKLTVAPSQVIGGVPGVNYEESEGTSVTIDSEDLNALLETGAYSLTKFLQVHPDTLDKHLAHYMANLTPACLPDFFVNTTDCYDELPAELELGIDDIFDMNTCFISGHTMKMDLMPGGQYGSLDPADLTSIFNAGNVLSQGNVDASKKWQNPLDAAGVATDYLEENGDISYLPVVWDEIEEVYVPAVKDGVTPVLIDGQLSVKPKDLENSEDFKAAWRASWADALVPYHPEYDYLAFYNDLCEQTYGSVVIEGVTTDISSEDFNLVLQGITTYAAAASTSNPFGLSLIPALGSGAHILKQEDPYFNFDYTLFEDIVDMDLDGEVNPFKEALMDEILDNYKDNPESYNIWQIAVKIIACATDYAGTCDFVAADADPASTFFTGLTTAQKDQIWNTYKQLYLSEKAKINQIFADVYAIRQGIYNGYIGDESASIPNLSAFLYYPTFLLPVATEVKIMSLYSDAIADVADGEYPWLTPEDVSEFGEKVKRFEPIYGSFDGGLPEEVMAAEMEDEIDTKLYIETGKCPLHLDGERLLNGLAMGGLLADGTAINWDDFGALSIQLYEAMGGQTGLDDVFITAEEVGSTLEVQVENAATGDFTVPPTGTMKKITLNSPTEGDWADVVGVEMLYYIPESGLDGTYNFEILLQMQVPVGAEMVYVEEVITGFTSLVIGDCYEPEVLETVLCDRTENFAADLMAIFNHFYDPVGGGLLTQTATNALDELGGWYAGSEIRIQLLDDASAATVASSNSEEKITVVFGGRTIYIDFTSLPSDIALVTGAIYNEADIFSELTIYYLDTDGETQTMTADVNDFCSVDCSFLDFTCPEEICVPLTLAPKSCTQQWENYHTVIDVLNADLEEELDYEEEAFPTYTKDQFCDTRLAYSVEAYLSYISAAGFTIDSPEDTYYLTLAEFAATQLNAYYDYNEVEEVYEAISAYKLYVTEEPANPYLSWGDYVNSVYLVDEVSICPPDPMPYYPEIEFEYPCELYTANVDTVNAKNQLEIYLEKLAQNFRERYLEEAISSVVETFTATFNDKEYHYTLYYYDQAGNLIQTVPPKGVDRFEAVLDQDKIELARNTPDYYALNPADQPEIRPVHDYNTQYHYNSLNQLVWQSTPDGGESYFGYDKLGRLVVSQNAKQKAYNLTEDHEQFSYTRYDALGRIIEVGEMTVEEDVYGFNENGRLITLVDGELVEVSAVNFPINLGTNLIAQEEVTRTQYDELFGIESTKFADYSADNTRNRITGVYYFETFTGVLAAYDNATFYDYDVHGNVKEMLQDINDEHLEELEQDVKKVNYEYDLVSGNVKHVTYQKDQADQFIHEYEYDSDNRITNVRTSKDEVIWEQDAKYFYYNHGPLARTEIGDKKVQATDYAYTIQGWLKGVNSENLTITDDQGKDAKTGINRMNAKDAFGYSLHYYNGDYTARHGNDFLSYSSAATTPTNLSLYNGNIREMYTASTNTGEEYIGTSHTLYQYDQLNRIKAMEQEELTGAATPTHAVLGGYYASNYSYDENGNLMTLNRWAKDGVIKSHIDEFTYHYTAGKNQLTHVYDEQGGVIAGADLASQAADNYTYDQIGQLIGDVQEEIEEIQWKVTGKVHKIIRDISSDKENLEFVYDAMGNRIIKKVFNAEGELLNKTYYIRDAQGNVMSIYTLIPEEVVAEPEDYDLQLTERDIYGSSRHGTENINQVIASTIGEHININTDLTQVVGDRSYELSNHLGNVLQVVTDRKLAIDSGDYNPETGTYYAIIAGGDGVVDYYVSDVVSQSDYYPFGMMLPGRNSSDDSYRYGFQGYEADDEVKGQSNSYTTEFRQYDPRLGKWLSLDPVVKHHESPYASFANNPIWFIDPNGADSVKINDKSYFQVEEGDTYASISKRTGVSEIKLQEINGLGLSSLVPGQVLSFDVRTHFVYESLTPTIYQTTVTGLAANPAWFELTFIGRSPEGLKWRDRNRYFATKKCGTCSAGNTRDEFPYATTTEGGVNAICWCTPVKEQNTQAVQLRLFYRGMNAGDTFNVVTVAKDLKPEPRNVLVPVGEPVVDPKIVPVLITPARVIAPVPATSPGFFLTPIIIIPGLFEENRGITWS